MSDEQQERDERHEDLEPGTDEAAHVVGGAPKLPDTGPPAPPPTPPGVPIPYPNTRR
jgi:hypothetical protein